MEILAAVLNYQNIIKIRFITKGVHRYFKYDIAAIIKVKERKIQY